MNVQNKNIQGSIRQNLNNTISFIVYDANKSQVVGSSGDNAAEIFARKVSLNANNKELYPAVASVVSDEGGHFHNNTPFLALLELNLTLFPNIRAR